MSSLITSGTFTINFSASTHDGCRKYFRAFILKGRPPILKLEAYSADDPRGIAAKVARRPLRRCFAAGLNLGAGLQATGQVWRQAQQAVGRLHAVLVAPRHLQPLAVSEAGVHRERAGLLHRSRCRSRPP